MKKLISILLAVSVLAMSTMASAGTALKAGGQVNPGSASNNSGNSNYLRDYMPVPLQLAVYRPGDTLTFSNDTEKMLEGDVITFISSKVDAEDLDSSTVMFIDQVVAESNSPSYSYKIREGLEDGIYKLDIKIGSKDVKSFYYGVGNPVVTPVTVDGEKNYHVQEFNGVDHAFYFAAVTMSGELKFRTFANGLGVKFGEGEATETSMFEDAMQFDNYAVENNMEIGGEMTFVYVLPVELDNADLDPADLKVEAYIDAK